MTVWNKKLVAIYQYSIGSRYVRDYTMIDGLFDRRESSSSSSFFIPSRPTVYGNLFCPLILFQFTSFVPVSIKMKSFNSGAKRKKLTWKLDARRFQRCKIFQKRTIIDESMAVRAWTKNERNTTKFIVIRVPLLYINID